MKILHISTFDYGGAGLSCIRLHKGLINQGIESKILVLDKRSDEAGVFKFEKREYFFSRSIDTFYRIIKFIFRNLRIPLTRFQLYQYNLQKINRDFPAIYNLPFSECDISNHPLILWADIIHLQWVTEFLDYPSFFKSITKPILWTIHDLNLYYGGFHFRREYERNILEYKKVEEKLVNIKRKSIKQCRNLSIVSISKNMLDISLSNEIVKNRKHYLIHNSVDDIIFRPYDKFYSREIFRLPKYKKILCFAAYYIDDENKGLYTLIKALEDSIFKDLILCTIGTSKNKIESSVNIFDLGAINDQRLLSIAYSSCDLLVMPSFQEGFSQTPLEAMACGLPVVAFPFSGTDELITEENGICTSDYNVEALKNGISEALNKKYNGNIIRQNVIENYGIRKIAKQYSDVYYGLLGINA